MVVKKLSVTVVCAQPSFWVTAETLLYPVLINHVQERAVCAEVLPGGLLEMRTKLIYKRLWQYLFD